MSIFWGDNIIRSRKGNNLAKNSSLNVVSMNQFGRFVEDDAIWINEESFSNPRKLISESTQCDSTLGVFVDKKT